MAEAYQKFLFLKPFKLFFKLINEINKINEINETDEINEIDETNEINGINEINETNHMPRLLFSLLSILYIAGIFLFANSPVVSKFSAYNPWSILHIPLYGILTILLIFSFLPFKIKFNQTTPNRFLFVGLIAISVAISDEIYQTYIPDRNGSLIDLLIDSIGIIGVLFISHRITQKPNKRDRRNQRKKTKSIRKTI